MTDQQINQAFQEALEQEQNEMDAAQTEHLKKRLPQLRYQFNKANSQLAQLIQENQRLIQENAELKSKLEPETVHEITNVQVKEVDE